MPGSVRQAEMLCRRWLLHYIVRGFGYDVPFVENAGFFVNSFGGHCFNCAEGPKIGKTRMKLDQENIVGQVTLLGVT